MGGGLQAESHAGGPGNIDRAVENDGYLVVGVEPAIRAAVFVYKTPRCPDDFGILGYAAFLPELNVASFEFQVRVARPLTPALPKMSNRSGKKNSRIPPMFRNPTCALV